MKTQLNKITIRELFKGYHNDPEVGVWGFDGKLNIRPAYQREFVYNDKQQKAVINSIINNFPLNVIYWVKKENGTFELLDGQQRTLSICEFLANNYSIKIGKYDRKWHQLEKSKEGTQILDYELYVYYCVGDPKAIVDWFEVINTAGEKLNKQEILNAVYSSPWLTDAKKKFSKRGCPAFQIGSAYLKGSAIRQDYLKTVLGWINDNKVDEYLKDKLTDKGDASGLYEYFEKIVTWIETVFPNKTNQMKGVNWGYLYKTYGATYHDPKELGKKLQAIADSETITFTSKAYTYVFTGNKRDLQVRAFTKKEKANLHAKLGGTCSCELKKEFALEELEGDHIVAWSKGGETVTTNLQLLCKPCNGRKSNK